jgi:hypothetical protein
VGSKRGSPTNEISSNLHVSTEHFYESSTVLHALFLTTILFYRSGNGGPKMLNNLPKITHPLSHGASILTQIERFQNPCPECMRDVCEKRE